MDRYEKETYGEKIADTYDEYYSSFESSAIDLIFEFSKGRHVLELGIGTGRIAIPLKKKGVDISGIDASPSMIKHLRTKPEGSNIPVVLGDFSDINIDDSFDLIYVVFNTFFALTTQELQLKCFRNVSKHLKNKGKFLIEAFVPDLGRFDRDQTVRTTSIKINEVIIDVSQHDIMNQQVISQHIVLTEKGTSLYPVIIRYAWPSELDLMAQISGMKKVNRWEDWKKSPFTSHSSKHISIYELK